MGIVAHYWKSLIGRNVGVNSSQREESLDHKKGQAIEWSDKSFKYKESMLFNKRTGWMDLSLKGVVWSD